MSRVRRHLSVPAARLLLAALLAACVVAAAGEVRAQSLADFEKRVVEHKLDMVLALSDTIAVLKDGRLIAEGSPAAVTADPAVQAAYFGGGEGA